jgi:hypothetical protein
MRMDVKIRVGAGAPTGNGKIEDTNTSWLIKTAWLLGVLIIMVFGLSGCAWADKCDITFVKEIKEPREELSELGWNPVDVAVDSNGRIIVADVTNDRILIFDKDGGFIKI